MQQIYTPQINYKVQARCLTYNQAKYIEDALNGFAMQQTNFSFVCLVIDDCSTDGEQEVIKAWMERECDMDKAEYVEIEPSHIILVPHKTNKSCSFAFYLLKKNLYKEKQKKQDLIKPWRDHCEYEALCEGDDYWIDPQKLQKQVLWLENHQDYSMCCSDAKLISPNGELNWHRYDSDSDITPNEMIIGGGGYIQTCTIVYRRSLMYKYPSFMKKCHVGDYPLQMWAAICGKVRYFATKTAIYRYQHADSWTSRNDSFDEGTLPYGWKSEMDLLLDLDAHTNYKYHKSFKARFNLWGYRMLIWNRGRVCKEVIDSYPNVIQMLPTKQRIYVKVKRFLLDYSIYDTLHKHNILNL